MLLAGNGFAQNMLSLEEAMNIAIENNYRVKVAKNQKTVSENNVSYGNAGFLPDISLDGSVNYQSQNSSIEFADGSTQDRSWARSQSYNAALNLDYTLFDGMERFTTYDILQENARIQKEQLKQEKLQLKTEVARTYYQVVLAKDRQSIRKQSLQLSKKRLKYAKNKYELGRFSRAEYLSAKVDYNTDTAAYLRAQNNFEQARIQLNELLERAPLTPFRVQDSLSIPSSSPFSEMKEAMISGNPQLNTARALMYRAQMERKRQKARFLPKLDMNAAYNYTYSQAEAGFLLNNQNDGPSIGLSLSIPIFQGKNRSRALQNYEIQVQSEQWRMTEIKNELTARLSSLHTTFQNQLNLARLEQENADIARQNEQLSLQQYQEGAINALTFREAQQNAIDTDGRYLEALYQAHLKLIDIKMLTGQL